MATSVLILLSCLYSEFTFPERSSRAIYLFYFILFFKFCSISVVPIFSPSLSPPLPTLASHIQSSPLGCLFAWVLYTCSLMTLPFLSPLSSSHLSSGYFSQSFSLGTFYDFSLRRMLLTRCFWYTSSCGEAGCRAHQAIMWEPGLQFSSNLCYSHAAWYFGILIPISTKWTY